MPAGYNPAQWDAILENTARLNGLDPDLLKAIARQEDVNPNYYNPLGRSTPTHVIKYPGMDTGIKAVESQGKFLVNPSGAFKDFARTGETQDLVKEYSPVGAKNDVFNTNATEGAGIIANLAKLKGQSPVAAGTGTTYVPPVSLLAPPESGPTIASANPPAPAVPQPAGPTAANSTGEMNLILALQKLFGGGGA